MRLRKFRRNRQGRCFELAYLTQQDNPEWILIHGIADNTPHAWLEKNEEIYDAVLNRRMSKTDYQLTHGAIPDKEYSHLEAAILAVKMKHFGPYT
jgi:hypothetical protein